MDFNSVTHAYNKIMADRASSDTIVRSNNQRDAPPPAYSPAADLNNLYATDMASDTDSEAEDDNNASHSATPGQTLTIDSATVIQGSNNIIAVPPIDGPRLTTILLSLLHGTLPTQIQARQQQQQQQQAAHGPPPAITAAPQHFPGHLLGDGNSKRPPLSIHIDCGMRIVGDRNVVGGLPSSSRTSAGAAGPSSSAGVAMQQQNGCTTAKRGDGGRDEPSAGGMLTPPETPLSSGGDGIGSKKRKAEEEVDAETGGGEVKRERVDGTEGRV